MLRAEENEILTRVGPGTLMGELLRRYWTPACLAAEVPEPGGAPARVRLLGENLVAYRDGSGRVGLLQENCPHRGASLYFGRNEGAALRCVYHGWAFDADGRCVDMPSEPQPFCDKVRMRAYPTHESGGIVWTYMGPRETMTPFRDFGTEGHDAAEFMATKQVTTCNWVQAMEGNLDTAHISHLHQFDGIDDIPDDGSDKPGYPSNAMSWKFWRHDRAPRLELEETWYGYRSARHTDHAQRQHPRARHRLRAALFDDGRQHPVQRRPGTVRADRRRELLALFHRAQGQAESPRARRREPLLRRAVLDADLGLHRRHHPAPLHPENDYLMDRDAQRTGIFSGVSDFVSQDLMVIESMGPIYDRTQEQLGSTDRAISRMRHVLISAAKGLADGKEPPAVAAGLGYA